MTQQEDRVPEKPKNPVSDILKRQKSNTILQERQAKVHKQTNQLQQNSSKL